MVAPTDAYLSRLGLEREPPSAEGLARIHRAHVERVPYETLWIHLGERWTVDPAASLDRIAGRRRGGYCYHLNGALSELLRDLGYDVVRHVGGVHGPDGPAEADLGNHLVLTVRGLPTDEHPDGTWYVDAGLGDALHDPLPLRAGTYRSGPFRFVLEETPGGVGDWHLAHDPAGGFTGMAWRSAPAGMAAFADRHVHM
jgi:N-hydroxyarylamine O-acetyltransferase